MRSLTFSPVCWLSLLPSLSISVTPVLSTLEKPFHLRADTPPPLYTVDKPFILRAATPQQWNVYLAFDEIVDRFGDRANAFWSGITRSSYKPPQFTLTKGNLTTTDARDGLTAAFYGYSGPLPNLPRPLLFGSYTARTTIGFGFPPVFAAETVSNSSSQSKLQLILLEGRKLRTLLLGKEGKGGGRALVL